MNNYRYSSKRSAPLREKYNTNIAQAQRCMGAILSDRHRLVIIGSCSAATTFEHQLVIILHIYYAKPRISKSWKSWVYDLFLNESDDLKQDDFAVGNLLIKLNHSKNNPFHSKTSDEVN